MAYKVVGPDMRSCVVGHGCSGLGLARHYKMREWVRFKNPSFLFRRVKNAREFAHRLNTGTGIFADHPRKARVFRCRTVGARKPDFTFVPHLGCTTLEEVKSFWKVGGTPADVDWPLPKGTIIADKVMLTQEMTQQK